MVADPYELGSEARIRDRPPAQDLNHCAGAAATRSLPAGATRREALYCRRKRSPRFHGAWRSAARNGAQGAEGERSAFRRLVDA